jgi:hypothetical protein
MLYLLIGYLFLYIERPWEFWSFLAPLHIERIYMCFVILVFLFWKEKQIRYDILHLWIIALLLFHFISAPFAYLPNAALDQGFEYLKIVIFYFLIVMCIRDEKELRKFMVAFIVITALYMSHSLWEYLHGRHEWRMGISRMVGIDTTAGDPNAFAGTIAFSLPFLFALLKTEKLRLFKCGYYAYIALAVSCVVLTGSRTGAVLVVLFLVTEVINKRKFVLIALSSVFLFGTWYFMPQEKQDRIESIWNTEKGPQNARTSALGRVEGLKSGLRVFWQNPFIGIGPGKENFIAYRVRNDDGVPFQTHSLAGEVMAELGAIGGLLFVMQIVTAWSLCRKLRHLWLSYPGSMDAFLPAVGRACAQLLLLLLVAGLAGHDMYRPQWLWAGAWALLAYTYAKDAVFLAAARINYRNSRFTAFSVEASS